jgi:hypothetical protein
MKSSRKVMSMLNSLKERLKDCQQYRLDEMRSSSPSKLYIQDLDETIASIENQIRFYEKTDGAPVIVGKV